MDLQRRPPEFILEIFADAALAKELVTGILHTVFFHRFFPSIRPKTQEVLDLTLPYVDDVELETLVDQRVRAFIDQIKLSTARSTSPRGEIAIMFFERRRRKTWFNLSEEDVCWEQWVVKFTLASPRTETERSKLRKAMELQLQNTVLKIINIVNTHKDHIPPITTSESNPFPYQVVLNPRDENWGARMGIF